jgi:putative NIF3 family GTP cyclohydrolase 1 type 2
MALVESDKPLTHVGVVAGAGAELAMTAVREGCEVFVTGEMKHHEVVEMLNAGCSVLLAGHTNTERGYLKRLAKRLMAALPGLTTRCSTADRDILVAVP